MAAAAGMTVVPHMSGGGLGYLDVVHYASFTPNIGPFMEFKGNASIPVHCPTSSLKAENGIVRCPDGPGFGVENDQFVDYTARYDRSLGGAAGGLQSTAADLQRFARAVMSGVLLDAQSETEMQTFVPGQRQGDVRHEYGLGLEKYIAGNLAVYGHLGSSAAHSAFFAFEPDSGVTAAVLINVEEAAPAAYMAIETVGAMR